MEDKIDDQYQFDDVISGELKDTESDSKTSEVVKQRLKEKSELQERVKDDPKPLELKVQKPRKIHFFKKNDYITFRCNVCEVEETHSKKDDDGNFMPWQLCPHVVFKGLVAED